MAAKAGFAARLRITSAVSSSSTNNAADLSTDGVTLSITDTGKRHWDRTLSTGLAVFQNAADVTGDIASINYVQGKVTFAAAKSTSATYTIDVDSFTSTFVAQGRSWSGTAETEMLDQTTFSTTTSDGKWRTVAPGLSGGSVDIERLWASTTGPAFFDRFTTQTAFVVELIADQAATDKLEGFAYVEGDDFEVPVDGSAMENVRLRFDGPVYRSTA
jgi:hypothetical protein